jgi:hypothetical protein
MVGECNLRLRASGLPSLLKSGGEDGIRTIFPLLYVVVLQRPSFFADSLRTSYPPTLLIYPADFSAQVEYDMDGLEKEI